MRERCWQTRSELRARAKGILLKVEAFGWLRALYDSTARKRVAIVGCRRHRRWWEYGFMLKGLLAGNLDSMVLYDVARLRPAHHEAVVSMHVAGFLGPRKEYGGKAPERCRVVTSYWLERAMWLLGDGEALAREVLRQLDHVSDDLGQ